MLRHALAPLFEPRTLLVVSDRPQPVLQSLPAGLRERLTRVDCEPGEPPVDAVDIADAAAAASAADASAAGEADAVQAGGTDAPQAGRTNAPQSIATDAPQASTTSDGSRLQPAAVDLALVCVAPSAVPATLAWLSRRRPAAAIFLPHDQADPDVAATRALCREWAIAQGCALLGPNSFGLQRPHAGLNLSQHPSLARSGRVALVAQSRAIMAAVMDWAEDVQIGFSTALALGDEAVLGLPEVLDYLAGDSRTDSIALYVEDVGFAREFVSALRAAASVKPVVVLKAGRALDTSLADAAFDAALGRAGAVRVRYFLQLFSAVKVLGYTRRPKGRRIALFSNGSGPPQLALDLMGENAPTLRAELGPGTLRALGDALEPSAMLQNPVISYLPLTPARVQAVLDPLLEDANVDGVIVLLAPDARSDMPAVVAQLAEIAPRARKPVITCFMGDAGMRPLRRRMDDAGTPAFRTPEAAADAFGVLASYHYNQQLLMQTQPPEPLAGMPDLQAGREVIARARAENRRALAPHECLALLHAFRVPLMEVLTAPAAVHEAAHQPWACAAPADAVPTPLALHVTRDSRFGPIVRLGAGGVAGLLEGPDRGMDLAPLNTFLARQLIERSRVFRRVLATAASPAALVILQDVLEQVAALAAELPDIDSIEIDPLYMCDSAVTAGGVSMTLSAEPACADAQARGYPHMAIHPYPSRWVQGRAFEDGTPWTIRPIRPEDAEALQEFIRGLSERTRYMRFVSMMRELTPRMLARYTQVDYHRELALVATTQVPNPAHRGHPREIIIGLAHYLRNPDGRGAEYALVVGDDWQRRRLGGELMKMLIDAARVQGLTYIDGLVLADNRPMLTLMTRLGFVNDPDPDDPTMRRVWLDLD